MADKKKETIGDKLPDKGEEEQEGEFKLSDEEMQLAIRSLAERPELKVYNDFIVGQSIASMLVEYEKVMAKRKEKKEFNELP